MLIHQLYLLLPSSLQYCGTSDVLNALLFIGGGGGAGLGFVLLLGGGGGGARLLVAPAAFEPSFPAIDQDVVRESSVPVGDCV